jgi:predicted restriction endonuclease
LLCVGRADETELPTSVQPINEKTGPICISDLRSSDAKRLIHHCSIHHIDYWENGGQTDLDNLIPLCSRHHHKAHEGGWKLSLDPNSRQLTVNYP